ncbi:MAG TPA: ABC transporter permease [Vicinamibacterales bacterium]|nr:ABC transporter permease [Vicinamibacterales bacterium]
MLTGSLRRDLGLAMRRLRQSPTFTVFAIVTLGLGIGVATAAYSAMYVLALRPSGVDSTNLVVLSRSNAVVANMPGAVTWADYEEFAAQQSSLSQVAAWTRVPLLALAGPRSSAFVDVEAVTGGYFTMLGVRALHGRLIQPADDEPSASPVIVLAEPTWHQHFESDPTVVGMLVRLGGRPVQIVGVARAGFRGATGTYVGQFDGWVPSSFLAALPGWVQTQSTRASYFTGGRLRPGVTTETAAADAAAIAGRLDVVNPLPPLRLADAAPVPAVRAWTLTDASAVGLATVSEASRVIVGLPILVLLVACTNLSSLVISRGTSRRHACAVRAAMGASRARLIREEIAEVGIVAVAGGLLGAVVAHGLLSWTNASLRETMSALSGDMIVEWRLEPVVFVAAAAATALAMLVAGLLPAVQLTRSTIGRLLTTDPIGAAPRWRGRANLVALQVGVSVGLFLITVVCVRFVLSPSARGRIDPGVGLEGIVVATVPFERQQYDAARTRQAIDRVLADLRQAPGIERVAVTSGLPVTAPWLRVSGPFGYVTTPDRPFTARPTHEGRAEIVVASPEIFSIFDLETLAGRRFDLRDTPTGERVVVLDERQATKMFGTTDAAGRQVLLRLYVESNPPVELTATVVGVVASRPSPSGPGGMGLAYLPIAQHDMSTVSIVARSRHDDVRPLVGTVLDALRRADPMLAVFNAGRLGTMASGPFTLLRFMATTAGGLATLALALAMAGLYGVLSHVVSMRMREMGLRVALGAEPRAIATLIFRSGFRPVAEGLAIGLGSAFVLRQLLQSQLTASLSAIDMTMFMAAAVPLVVAGAVACLFPARRAARVDPNLVLRDL